MADDPTPTPNSDATPATPAPSDPPANPAAAADPSAADPAPTDPAPTEPTALGGAGDPPNPDPDADPNADPDAAAKAEVPEAYELAVPEGFEKLDPEAVAAATPVFKELGLSNDQANKLVPVAADFAKRIVADRDQQLLGSIAEQRKSWLEEAKADKEIGGAAWDSTLATAAKALDTLGFVKGSGLRNLLDESGLGNHPEMIRAFAKVGKAIGENADFPRGDAGAKVVKTTAEKLYGPQFTDGAKT